MSKKREPAAVRAADLLYGSKAIEAFLGVPKGITRHLIKSRLIPTFELGGTTCARRSGIAEHLARLEREAASS